MVGDTFQGTPRTTWVNTAIFIEIGPLRALRRELKKINLWHMDMAYLTVGRPMFWNRERKHLKMNSNSLNTLRALKKNGLTYFLIGKGVAYGMWQKC